MRLCFDFAIVSRCIHRGTPPHHFTNSHRRRARRSPPPSHAMFSNKLTRAAHRATSAALNSSTAASRSTTCIAARRTHQRRHSSSKASCPPDSNASGSKPAPATKASNVEEGKSHISPPTSQQRGSKRLSRPKRSRTVGSADKAEDHFAGLPAVPATQNLSYAGECRPLTCPDLDKADILCLRLLGLVILLSSQTAFAILHHPSIRHDRSLR